MDIDVGFAPGEGDPFYERLNRVLEEAGFDAYVEGVCQAFYADRVGRPSLAPGNYFRLLLVGYFEGCDSERQIAWRLSDSLSLRRLHLCCRENITKRLLIQAAGFNLGLWMRHQCGIGKPRSLQNRVPAGFFAFVLLVTHPCRPPERLRAIVGTIGPVFRSCRDIRRPLPVPLRAPPWRRRRTSKSRFFHRQLVMTSPHTGGRRRQSWPKNGLRIPVRRFLPVSLGHGAALRGRRFRRNSCGKPSSAVPMRYDNRQSLAPANTKQPRITKHGAVPLSQ